MKKLPRMDRRRFVQLMAASAAVVSTTPLFNVADAEPASATTVTATAPRHRPPTPAMRREIETQKKSLGDLLGVIRGYDLPPGSPPATIFRALHARKGR